MNAPRSGKGIQKFSDAEMIERHSMPVPECGCWVWLGSVNSWGYGRLGRGRTERQAHRLSYAAFRGAIPLELKVLHTCDIPACVNPDHLFLGTDEDNMHDMMAKGRHVAFAGEANAMSKLSEAAVRNIRSRTIEYGTISSLAREFGVSRRAIRFVITGATWSR